MEAKFVISGQGQGNLISGADGWMDIRNIDKCRPYGAWVWIVSFFYTDVAPLGLRRGGHRNATQMPPRWGLGLGCTAFLHRLLRSENPLGLNGSGHHDATQMSPRWG